MRLIKCIELCISGKRAVKLIDIINELFLYDRRCDYLTYSSRYLGQKKYSELLELLYDGATLLLQHEQVCNAYCHLYFYQFHKYLTDRNTFQQ